MEETRVRPADVADARAMAQVQVSAWQSAYRGLLPDSTLDRLTVEAGERQWQERLADPAGEYLVLTRGDRVVGFVGLGPTHDEDLDPAAVGEIHVLYVDPPEWRKGYGMTLLREALSRLEEQGDVQAVLWVLHDNEPAIAFYKAAGFTADDARRVKHRRDGTEMHVARYRRRLAGT